jgi:hypothetical protein
MDKQVKKVHQEIIHAARQKIPLNFNRFKHRWIVDALHSLVFVPSIFSKEIGTVRVAFADGTEARPFPLGGFTPSPPPDVKLPVVRVGLSSGRHPEMDRFIDMYLFRNAEINDLQSIAEQEQYAFQKGKEFLANPRWRGGGIIEMHQTGLEPLILGFYRAVVTVFQDRQKKGLPPIIILPRSWAPAYFSLHRYVVNRMPDEIELERIQTLTQHLSDVLEQVIMEFPGFFCLLHQSGDLVLKWQPERPMWETERDLLCARFNRLSSIWQSLYKSSRFMKHHHWGYTI